MRKFSSLFLILVLLIGAGIAWGIRANVFQAKLTPQNFAPARTASISPGPTISGKTPSPLPLPTRTVSVGPSVSQKAAGFALNTLEGKRIGLEDYRGKVVLLNFWASWCLPCKEEMPLIQTTYEKYRDQGLVVLGINMTDLDNRQGIEQFLRDTPVSFPILLDENGSTSNHYRVISVPTSFFIDQAGIIRHFQMGPMSAGQLQEYLDEMLP